MYLILLKCYYVNIIWVWNFLYFILKKINSMSDDIWAQNQKFLLNFCQNTQSTSTVIWMCLWINILKWFYHYIYKIARIKGNVISETQSDWYHETCINDMCVLSLVNASVYKMGREKDRIFFIHL